MRYYQKIASFVFFGFIWCLGIISLARAEAHASATPAPAPTARAATSTEQAIFLKFAPTSSGWKLDENAVAGPYAIFGVYNENSGITGLAYYQNGTWNMKTRTGGQLTTDDFAKYLSGIPASTAAALYTLAVKQANSTP